MSRVSRCSCRFVRSSPFVAQPTVSVTPCWSRRRIVWLSTSTSSRVSRVAARRAVCVCVSVCMSVSVRSLADVVRRRLAAGSTACVFFSFCCHDTPRRRALRHQRDAPTRSPYRGSVGVCWAAVFVAQRAPVLRSADRRLALFLSLLRFVTRGDFCRAHTARAARPAHARTHRGRHDDG